MISISRYVSDLVYVDPLTEFGKKSQLKGPKSLPKAKIQCACVVSTFSISLSNPVRYDVGLISKRRRNFVAVSSKQRRKYARVLHQSDVAGQRRNDVTTSHFGCNYASSYANFTSQGNVTVLVKTTSQ